MRHRSKQKTKKVDKVGERMGMYFRKGIRELFYISSFQTCRRFIGLYTRSRKTNCNNKSGILG